MRGALLLAILLVSPLAGCTREAPDARPAPAAACPADAHDCAHEWLNATLTPEGGERYHIAIPAPAFGLHRLLAPWAANATLEGNGTLIADDFGDGPVLLVNATGPVTLRSHIATAADPATGVAESYLRARWTTTPEDAGPTRLRVTAYGEPGAAPFAVAVNLTYLGRSGFCVRHAAFAGNIPTDQRGALPGNDEARCT